MNSMKYFLAGLMMLGIFSVTAQDGRKSDTTHFHFIKTIPGTFTDLNVDALENIFVITPDFQLKKMNSNGIVLSAFNCVKLYSNPTFTDVTNPMKILLYYEKSGFIVTLDKLLTVRNSFNIHTKLYFNIPAIASSYDNNIWIYDGAALKVKKIDDLGNAIAESQELSVFGDDIPEKVSLLADDKQVLLYDEQKGFYCFDWSGTYKDMVIPFLKWKHPGLNGNTVYGFKQNSLLLYEWQSLNLREFSLPDGLSENFIMKVINRKLYALTNDGIRVYEIY